MLTYRHENGEDAVVVQDETYTTYTRGTREALYSGPDADAARESLEWDEYTWNRVLMSDADEDMTEEVDDDDDGGTE
mgnify:CR=1 FL=1